MGTKSEIRHQRKQRKVLGRLRSAGIQVLPGEKSPKNGRYSGIVGNERKKLVLNIDKRPK